MKHEADAPAQGHPEPANPSGVTLWERVASFDEGQVRLWHVGSARFWVRRELGEWLIAHQTAQPTTVGDGDSNGPPIILGEETPPPDGLEWTRYVAGHTAKLVVRPVLPDRPVVVRPASPVKVLTGRTAQYFVQIPVWLAIMEATVRKQQVLSEHPGLPMSSTWFGDPDGGELCYSLRTILHRTPPEVHENTLTALCPLHIINEASTMLDFHRVCIRVPHLHLYRGARILSTNEVILTYRGQEQSQISFQDRAPEFDTEIRHVIAPRVAANRNIIKKSFELIRSLSLY